ncbi:hypothetical protein BDZ89DRAFT_724882 [Hymenopellis radicata]|nr:hypothetical protein BDZ89DRAFT_724882 [Hymenopellis radicata]
MTPGQPLVFHWRGLPYRAPPNYRSLFSTSRKLPGCLWEGKHWNILSAKEQTYWESVGRLLTPPLTRPGEKARREALGVVDVDFDIPPYDEALPLVCLRPAVTATPPPPARAQRVRPYRRLTRAGSAPPQTPSAPRAGWCDRARNRLCPSLRRSRRSSCLSPTMLSARLRLQASATSAYVQSSETASSAREE